ncbi:MAG: hypothetical protein HKN33_08660 [Pyrinomonadaceae bacterium]|nr:hypothetical protein [Pyrinomonadaceae bacterium]
MNFFYAAFRPLEDVFGRMRESDSSDRIISGDYSETHERTAARLAAIAGEILAAD